LGWTLGIAQNSRNHEAGGRYTKNRACGRGRPASRIITSWFYLDDF